MAMRILITSLATLFIFSICFLTVKYWGKSQQYTDYKHSMLQAESAPIEFIRPSFEHLEETIAGPHNIYLDVTVTFDQKLVIPKRKWLSTERPLRLFSYDEVKKDVILVTDIKDSLVQKKIIFNFVENAQAQHETFIHDMKKIGLESGQNFIVTSPFEAPLKALKELAPAFIYGSSQPEILKIVAMQSMFLLEATNLRADVIIHPIKIRNHEFFNEDLLAEFKRRYKKIIVGPIDPTELDKAKALQPFGIIINR